VKLVKFVAAFQFGPFLQREMIDGDQGAA